MQFPLLKEFRVIWVQAVLLYLVAGVNSSLAQGLITGSTTWTNYVEVQNTDAVPLSDFIGHHKLSFQGITLDGTANTVEIEAPFIDAVMDLDTTAGSLTADLTLVQLSVNSEGEGGRHFLAIEGSWRGTGIRLELDFQPTGMSAITGTVATPDVAPTPYHLTISAIDGRTWEFEGVAGADDTVPRTGNAHVLLMLDSSGSMQDNDPQDVRKSVARFVVDRLPAQAAVGVLDFDDDAQVLSPVQTGDAGKRGALSAIDRIDAEGSTDLGAALRGGLPQFQSTATGAKRAVILLTDGKGDYQGEAETYARMGIQIYTVGLGNQCDEALLSAMSSQTGGGFFKADDAGRLFQSFEAAIVDINDEQTFYTEQGTILPEEHRYLTFNVEVGLDQFVGMVTWPGSDLDLRLIGPDGQEAVATRTTGDRYEMVQVAHPAPGTWQAEIQAVDVAPAGEPFTFSTSGASDLRLETPAWNSSSGADLAPLVFLVTGPDRVSGLKGHLEVQTPGGQTLTVHLQRGAAAGELIAGRDGLDEPGDYQIQAVVTGLDKGIPFRREVHRTLHVQNKGPVSVTDNLISQLWARDVMVRLKAVKELGRQKCRAARPYLKELLSDPAPQVRQEVAWALARINTEAP